MVESICDSDILIKLAISDVLKKLIHNQKTIFVSDIVKMEIERLSKKLNEFSDIHDKIFEKGNSIILINSDEFSKSELNEINHTLEFHGITCGIQTLHPVKNMGEFVSLIYADYKGINIVRSDDKKFIDKIKSNIEYKHIELKNLNDTMHDLRLKDKERIEIMKIIEKESEKFANDKYTKTDTYTIDDLMNKFNTY